MLHDDEFEWYIEADPMAASAVLEEAIYDLVMRQGYELIPESECEPVTLPSGRVRIYCSPTVPLDDMIDDQGAFGLQDAGRLRVGAAALAGAALTFYPILTTILEAVAS